MTKKQLIMEKSIELFASQGFDATSVQQITEHCGISKGAFYLSFKSKDELILALIDHFMMETVSSIDCLVTNANDKEKLLYDFYYLCFDSVNQHSESALIFIKEQTHHLNDKLISKMHYYNQLIEKSILSIIEYVYGDTAQYTKYDLVYCIQGFIKTYMELFFFYNLPADFDTLCKSLVEKTNVLARHTTIPFLSQNLIEMIKQPLNTGIAKEQIIQMIEQDIDEIEESIEKESLILLKEELKEPSLNRALIKGLLENIRHQVQCKSTYYVLRSYFDFD
ncbi:TetR family transcriptional regulator [Virgibacillus profundi]|uniref:TetR family transcriptional regulator n=1 Tax=Virgibacillus profundi TaxID=2024555 RepID=A0A2A2ICN1_9BACI|nr:TetR/AcrR family transcriptional regulator [Virgibacillus profundi]PAV28833.1 TetR family transcriptional regulator [Virgibacillus profundi]PXY53001.1 TetR/AcrR family transcriptional regulator [Virgibacillus profundi]